VELGGGATFSYNVLSCYNYFNAMECANPEYGADVDFTLTYPEDEVASESGESAEI
jgi:hypothetical protein